ncbi:unnamed protein product [Protopolystoma xenopodis]|uniref:PDZ domain-containing protein n=1 Tax=Protopolystoma xenopodis TaxID=117903 RepID=A0A3S5AAB2_9PLAT|nr:unnamed protein product [Protopolystoma xenopodis]
MTDSTMSLNILTVTLNLDATVNFLGISIVGQSTRTGGDAGIYVGSIMRGGAVARDGRIDPGDMLLEVNGISFEGMTNDGAVRVLRDQVQKPGCVHFIISLDNSMDLLAVAWNFMFTRSTATWPLLGYPYVMRLRWGADTTVVSFHDRLTHKAHWLIQDFTSTHACPHTSWPNATELSNCSELPGLPCSGSYS